MCKNDHAAKRAAYYRAVTETAKALAEAERKRIALAAWRREKEIEHVNKAWYSLTSQTVDLPDNMTISHAAILQGGKITEIDLTA